jgi:hypothetical protein
MVTRLGVSAYPFSRGSPIATGSLSGNPATFTAPRGAGLPAILTKVAGDGQSAGVGAAVPVPPAV